MNSTVQLITKVILTSLLSILFTRAYSSPIKNSAETGKDTSTYVQIEGRIVVDNKEVKGNYLIEVLYFDSTLTSIKVKNNMPVTFLLKRNSPYVLKISKKGFIPRYICLNTNISSTKTNNNPYNFYFETDFIKVEEAMRMDNEALELPVGMIAYDTKIGNFEQNKGYSIFVRQRLHASAFDASQMSVKN